MSRIFFVIWCPLLAAVVATNAQPQPTRCQGIHSLWQHVYNPDRLEVRKLCAAVTGVISSKVNEHDGDVHIRLKLDSQFENLLNDGKRVHQGGNLVVEPICDHEVTQADAVAACENFHPMIPRFKSGTRVMVVGSYVHDKEHGWMEIHPIVRMTEIR